MHSGLTDVTADQHHAQNHAARHATGQPDALTAADVGASPAVHNHDAAYSLLGHAHVLADGDIPATIARDAEVAAGYATVGHTHAGAGVTGGAIRKTANQTMTATAQTAITDLSFAVAATSTYWFRVVIRVTTSTGTSPTSAYGVTGPASPTAVGITQRQDTSTSVQATAVLTAFGNFAAGAQVANTGAEIEGVIQTGASGGTVQITVARAGTTPSMVIPAGVGGVWLKLA